MFFNLFYCFKIRFLVLKYVLAFFEILFSGFTITLVAFECVEGIFLNNYNYRPVSNGENNPREKKKTHSEKKIISMDFKTATKSKKIIF